MQQTIFAMWKIWFFYINVSWVFPVLRINCIENFLLFVTKSNTVAKNIFNLVKI